MSSIIELPDVIFRLSEEGKELFNRFFDIRGSIGKLVIPKEMKPWIEKTFGSVEAVNKQKIIKVFNKLTFETAMFNELRANKPAVLDKKAGDVKKEINESTGGPFCKPLTMTPADTFGRIKGKFCITASNVAKYDGLHGLIIFNKHNPLDFTEEEVQDYFNVAIKWFKKAHRSNKDAVYPFLIWNCLWRAAAGITHGHMQVALGEGSHYGEAEFYNKVRRDYYLKYKSDYYYDFYKLHELIGLGLERDDLRIFTNIVPRKDNEVTIISDKFDKAFMSAVYKVAYSLVKDFGVLSYNIAIIYPPLNKDDEWKGFPVIMRIVDRGKLSSKTTDMGGMEVYARSNIITTDPYKVFEKIRGYF